LVDAGHDIRLLVRDPALVATVLGPLGVEVDDVVVGDVTDADAVTRAVGGCDAVVHAAAMVGAGRRDEAAMLATNVGGTERVLGAAAAAGLDPIVHVSSFTAIFHTDVDEIGPDAEVAEPKGPYGRSKADAERFARGMQAAGAPVVITYPAGVLGPQAGPRRSSDGPNVFCDALRTGFVAETGGAVWSIVDVRDVAAVHAAALEAGRGPRRYCIGGWHLSVNEVFDLVEQASGRHIRRIGLNPRLMRGLGRLADVVSAALPLDTWLSHEAMVIHTLAPPLDDRTTRAELGIEFRDPLETVRETIRGLLDSGDLTPAQAGAVAVAGDATPGTAS
jgi:nucleoside-diphosphate-sugar epimerase